MPETVDELLIKLKNLRVQEEEVIQELERAVERDRADREQQTKPEPLSTNQDQSYTRYI